MGEWDIGEEDLGSESEAVRAYERGGDAPLPLHDPDEVDLMISRLEKLHEEAYSWKKR